MRNGYVGRMFGSSYYPLPDIWDWYETLEDAVVSLQNRYDGYDDFWSCEVTSHGEVVNVKPESARFPAVYTDAEITLHRVVNGRIVDPEYPSYLIRLTEEGDAYVEEC